MATLEMFSWWYLHGWSVFIGKVRGWFAGILDFFSMGSLLRTLFSPYRQISAEKAGDSASLDVRFHMFLDRLLSRVIGFFTRLILLIVGTVLIILGGIFSLVLIIIWPLVPLLPIAGIAFAMMGVLV